MRSMFISKRGVYQQPGSFQLWFCLFFLVVLPWLFFFVKQLANLFFANYQFAVRFSCFTTNGLATQTVGFFPNLSFFSATLPLVLNSDFSRLCFRDWHIFQYRLTLISSHLFKPVVFYQRRRGGSRTAHSLLFHP